MLSRLLTVGLPLVMLCCAAQADLNDEPIKPIPQPPLQNSQRVALGRSLFYDARLSANGTVSCSSCHNLSKGGADQRAHSIGFAGESIGINTPTVFNAALNIKQFWNGRAETLEAQIDIVIQNPAEMGSTWPAVVSKVAQDARYKTAFANAYQEGVTKETIRDAIASFERSLLTPDAPFDKYLRGDQSALTKTEKTGYLKFKQYGCVSCHQGVNVGGNMFQKFGVMSDYFAGRSKLTAADLGRYSITQRVEDKHVFKVPGLRNVALTAPYFHDASARTLEEAVDIMFKYQLGRTASVEDKRAIVQFLGTLTGRTAAVAGSP